MITLWARRAGRAAATGIRPVTRFASMGLANPTDVLAERFHFQVRTGTHVMVTEFADLADTEEARLEAAKRIGELLQVHAGKLWADEEWQMDVTDDVGLILFVINIDAMRSAATEDPRGKRDPAK